MEEGVARIGFNMSSPQTFRMLDSHNLQSGQQHVTFKVRVVPVDWGDRGDFAVLVNMGPQSDSNPWKPTASVTKSIQVSP